MIHAISCPECSHEIAIKDTRPGRFRVKCPACAASFTLAVPDDPALPPVASIEATPAPTVTPATPPVPDDLIGPPPPRWFAGYRVGEGLNRGGPVPSYRARRWAVAGDVALGIMTPRRAADRGFVARWTREAYAAARLDHPNLAMIRAFGLDQGRPFVLSELAVVPTRAEQGPAADRSAIVARFLHAARGLKLAHDQAVFHRHLGVASLIEDDQGIVRVAGLGTGMTPEMPPLPAFGPVPVPGVAPGPPDPNDPAVVAAREDVAALGRALRQSLGGDVGRGLPPGLAAVVRRMVEGGPAGPFADMAAVVAALEEELGVAGPFTPRDDEAHAWEEAAKEFVAVPLARLRPMLVLGGWGLCGLMAHLFLWAGKPFVAVGLVGFAGLVAAALVATRGMVGPDPLARRVGELALGGDRGDWATVAAGVILAVVVLAVTHLLWLWLFLAGLAAALAVAFHFALERPLAQARVEAIGRATTIVQGLRRLGVAEDDVRRFACRQAGRDWEELYESLFGYDALRVARARWGIDLGGKIRPRHARWRDLFADAIDRKLGDRRRVRDRATLQAIEEQGREARGVNLLTARRQAHRASEAMVHVGDEYGRSWGEGLGRPLGRAMVDAAERPDAFLASTWSDDTRAAPPAWRAALETVVGLVAGPRARFLVGGLLLAGSLLWMDQNGIISGATLKQEALAAVEERGQALADAKVIAKKLAEGVRGAADAAARVPAKPLRLPFLPPGLAGRLDGLGLGVAGLILLIASAAWGTRISLFVLPAALVASFGPGLLNASARPMAGTSLLCHAIAAGLLGLGWAFGKERA